VAELPTAAVETEVESLRTQVQGLVAMLTRLEAADTPWPLKDILSRLADGADHLLAVHCCDHCCDPHGYEDLMAARDAARRLIASCWP
jgi:hypothetical protein